MASTCTCTSTLFPGQALESAKMEAEGLRQALGQEMERRQTSEASAVQREEELTQALSRLGEYERVSHTTDCGRTCIYMYMYAHAKVYMYIVHTAPVYIQNVHVSHMLCLLMCPHATTCTFIKRYMYIVHTCTCTCCTC